MIKRIKLIIKGILLWLTAIVVALSVCGIDSIMDKGLACIFGITILDLVIIYICANIITKEELLTLTGYKILSEEFNIKLEE